MMLGWGPQMTMAFGGAVGSDDRCRATLEAFIGTPVEVAGPGVLRAQLSSGDMIGVCALDTAGRPTASTADAIAGWRAYLLERAGSQLRFRAQSEVYRSDVGAILDAVSGVLNPPTPRPHLVTAAV